MTGAGSVTGAGAVGVVNVTIFGGELRTGRRKLPSGLNDPQESPQSRPKPPPISEAAENAVNPSPIVST